VRGTASWRHPQRQVHENSPWGSSAEMALGQPPGHSHRDSSAETAMLGLDSRRPKIQELGNGWLIPSTIGSLLGNANANFAIEQPKES